MNPGDNEEVVLWSGPKREIWEQGVTQSSVQYQNVTYAEVVVETSTWRARYRVLPLMLPVLSHVFFEYVSFLLSCLHQNSNEVIDI